jgi:lipopolysaccharide export system permease protein
MLVLLSLGAFIEFVSQLDDLGQGDYTMATAVQYVALKMPRLAVGLLPICVLLGSLLGLGALASGSELIVMRAAGISVRRLAGAVALSGLVFALLGGVVGEFMAPQMDLYARQLRAVAKSGNADVAGASAWIRDADTIFNVRPSIDGIDDGGVYVYRLGGDALLSGIGRGESVESGGEWGVGNYSESIFDADGVSLKLAIEQVRVGKLTDLLAITTVRESSLTGQELWAYVQHLKSNGLDADTYEIAFWSRVATVVGIAIMCILALPFVFGSLRTTGAGARMIFGVLIGLGYFLLSRMMADSAAVFDLSPFVVAWIPTLLLVLITGIGLRRLG